MRWVVVRAVRFMTPLWQILTLKRSPGTRTGLFAFNSRIVGKQEVIRFLPDCPLYGRNAAETWLQRLCAKSPVFVVGRNALTAFRIF
jgi:hypothetical protein